jgi:hypothetical protein
MKAHDDVRFAESIGQSGYETAPEHDVSKLVSVENRFCERFVNGLLPYKSLRALEGLRGQSPPYFARWPSVMVRAVIMHSGPCAGRNPVCGMPSVRPAG